MALKDMYEKWSDDRRILFVRWVFAIFIGTLITMGYGLMEKKAFNKKFALFEQKIDSLSDAVVHYEIERIVMQNEIDKLRENQIKFNNLEDQYAMPRILKSLNGDVFSINNAYYNDFMKPFGFKKNDYKNDIQFWGKETAEYLRSIEVLSLERAGPITVNVNMENPFQKGTYIDREVTINPLKDRYGSYIAFEVSISKYYK